MDPNRTNLERSGSGDNIPILPSKKEKSEIEEVVTEPLEGVAKQQEESTRIQPIDPVRVRTLSLGERQRQLGTLSRASEFRGSLPNLNLGEIRRELDAEPTMRGDSTHVIAPDGTKIEFRRAEQLGRGQESFAYDARSREGGRTIQRAYIEMGNYVDPIDADRRLEEQKAFYSDLNDRVPISVKAYGFNEVEDATEVIHVGILMDRGHPIFREEGLPEGERVSFCKALLLGVETMHRNGITHGDIKVCVEEVEEEVRDTSNLMLKENADGTHSPLLIDWGESVDHAALAQLSPQEAFERIRWLSPSEAFTPYELIGKLAAAKNALNTNEVTPRKRKKLLKEFHDLRLELDRFNTAVAIIQILHGNKGGYYHDVIRVQGATRGTPEPNIRELKSLIPKNLDPKLRSFLMSTIPKK